MSDSSKNEMHHEADVVSTKSHEGPVAQVGEDAKWGSTSAKHRTLESYHVSVLTFLLLLPPFSRTSSTYAVSRTLQTCSH